jgi:predicted RNA-binding protein
VEDVKEVTVNGQTVDLGDVFDEGTIEGEVKEIEDEPDFVWAETKLKGLLKLEKSILKPIIKASKLNGIEYSSLIFELGNRKLIAGQEDLIFQIAESMNKINK